LPGQQSTEREVSKSIETKILLKFILKLEAVIYGNIYAALVMPAKQAAAIASIAP
jgi:hypothetical protein